MSPAEQRQSVLKLWSAGWDTYDIAFALRMKEPIVLGLIHAEQDRRACVEA